MKSIPEISARGSLILWARFQIPVGPRPCADHRSGREGEKCRPLDHMREIPYVHPSWKEKKKALMPCKTLHSIFFERQIHTLKKGTTAINFMTVICKNMYLLTEWEGRTGKYLARGHGVRTEVRAPWPSAQYFPVRPDLTQSISILLYDHRAFPFTFFFSGSKIRNVAHFDRKVGIYIAPKLF